MNYFDRNGMITYIVIIVSAIIFNILGFAIINIIISNVFKVLYFIILIWTIFSFYKSKKKNAELLIFTFLPFFLLFTGIPFKVFTMVIVGPLFFFNDIKQVIRVIGILIYLIFIIVGTIGLCLGPFGAYIIIDQQVSPNNRYRVVTIDSDIGALGGDTYIKSEEIYIGVIKRDMKTLYHGRWGEKPKVIWVDNNIVNIDGKDMNIRTSEPWETKK